MSSQCLHPDDWHRLLRLLHERQVGDSRDIHHCWWAPRPEAESCECTLSVCGCNAVFLSTCCTKCLDTPALSCCFQLCRTKLKRSKLGNNTFELHSASDDSVLPWLLNRNVTSNAALLELSMLYGGNTCSDFWGFRLLALCVTVLLFFVISGIHGVWTFRFLVFEMVSMSSVSFCITEDEEQFVCVVIIYAVNSVPLNIKNTFSGTKYMTRHTPRWSVCRRLLGAGWPSRRWTTCGRSEPGGWPGWRCRKGGGTRRKRSSWETAETAGWIRRGRRTSTCCTKLWRVGFRGRRSSPLYVCECSRAVTYLTLCVSEWRNEEEQRISSSLRGAERKAALCTLLDQEMDLIAAIGRHHIAVHSDNYDKAVRNFLDKVRGRSTYSTPAVNPIS